MTLILDSGALIALERNERPMWRRYRAATEREQERLTHAGVVGQVWRAGPGQARLASALDGVDIREIDERLGRAAGRLLGATGLSDVIDAALALLAEDGDDVITADREDFARLFAYLGTHVELISP